MLPEARIQVSLSWQPHKSLSPMCRCGKCLGFLMISGYQLLDDLLDYKLHSISKCRIEILRDPQCHLMPILIPFCWGFQATCSIKSTLDSTPPPGHEKSIGFGEVWNPSGYMFVQTSLEIFGLGSLCWLPDPTVGRFQPTIRSFAHVTGFARFAIITWSFNPKKWGWNPVKITIRDNNYLSIFAGWKFLM